MNSRRLCNLSVSSIFSASWRKMISISLVVIALVSLCSKNALASPPFELDLKMMANRLTGTWLLMAADPRETIKMRTGCVGSLYAFLFQDWLVSIRSNKPDLIGSEIESAIVGYANEFKLNKDDPLGLLSYYEGDTLSVEGGWGASAQPLRNCNAVFASKKSYVQEVIKFRQWVDSLPKPTAHHAFIDR